MGKRASTFKSVDALNSGIQFYRGYRDVFYLYIGLAYGLQIVDAVVDAHLKDFDVSEDLTLHWEPTLLPTPGQPALLPTNPGVLFALRVKLILPGYLVVRCRLSGFGDVTLGQPNN